MAPGDLAKAVAGAVALGIGGFNVTIPHKEDIMACLDDITDEARAIGAVNTVHVQRRSLAIGHNTDGAGFLLPLERMGSAARPARRLRPGRRRRGARPGRRPCSAPAARGWSSPIAPSRAASASQPSCDARHPDADIRPIAMADAADAARRSRLVVNSTLHRHAPGRRFRSPLPDGCLGPDHVVYDIVYRPLVTPFLRQAHAAGATTIGGLDMLIGQGAAAFTIWTGLSFPLETVHTALEARLES